MKNKVYVVNFESEDGDYEDMNAVFSTMEKAKQYVDSEVDRLSGLDFNTICIDPDYYEATFIHTYIIYFNNKPSINAEKIRVSIIEYKVDYTG